MTWQSIEQVREELPYSGHVKARDALSVVEEALEAAEQVSSWHPSKEGWSDPAFHPQHRESVDALRAALARAREGIKP